MREVRALLQRFGITPCYKGYQEMLTAITLVVEDESRLTAVVSEVYMVTAKQFNKQWQAVERNLRFVVGIAWDTDPGYLKHLAGRSLYGRPETRQFLEIVCRHLSSCQER